MTANPHPARPRCCRLDDGAPEKLNAMDEQFFAEPTDVMRPRGDDDAQAVVLTGRDAPSPSARTSPRSRRWTAMCARFARTCAGCTTLPRRRARCRAGNRRAQRDRVRRGHGAGAGPRRRPGRRVGPVRVQGADDGLNARQRDRPRSVENRPALDARAELVQEVHSDAGLLPAAVQLATEIAAHSPLTTQMGKVFIDRAAVGGFSESVEATALLSVRRSTARPSPPSAPRAPVNRGRSPRWERSPGSRRPRASCAASGSARRCRSSSPVDRRERRT